MGWLKDLSDPEALLEASVKDKKSQAPVIVASVSRMAYA